MFPLKINTINLVFMTVQFKVFTSCHDIWDFGLTAITFLRPEVVGATELAFRKGADRGKESKGFKVELQASDHVREDLFCFGFHVIMFLIFFTLSSKPDLLI